MEDVDEDEDQEEVVVLGDVGCGAMRAGAALRAAAASAAATEGKMEGMSSDRVLGAGAWGGQAVTWRPSGPIRLAALGEGGAELRSPPYALGWAGLLQCVRACGLVSAGGTVRVGCIRGPGALGLGFRGSVRGLCAVHWAGWVCRGAWASLWRVCADCQVWGAVGGVRPEGLWRACVVVWADGGGPCRGARGCTRWSACVGHQVGTGEGGAGVGVWWGGVGLGSRVLCPCLCSLAAARLCGHL